MQHIRIIKMQDMNSLAIKDLHTLNLLKTADMVGSGTC
jgi:hypothetical protein